MYQRSFKSALFCIHLFKFYICYNYLWICIPKSVKRLTNLINKSLRIVTDSQRITPEVCKREQIFDFPMTFKYFCSIKMYQVISMNQHNYFAEKLASFQINHNHSTRSATSHNLSIPIYRSTKCQKSFPFVGTKFWNELTTSLRESKTIIK